jgi:type IV pilus assembly protein PilE
MKKLSFSRRRNGFTLIEVMITVVIIAILASIAIPSYQRYVIRAKRSAAQAQMMDIANRQQQFLLANRSYADKTTLAASGYSLPADVPGFVLTFTPSGAQQSDGNITLDNQGAKTPADKW